MRVRLPVKARPRPDQRLLSGPAARRAARTTNSITAPSGEAADDEADEAPRRSTGSRARATAAPRARPSTSGRIERAAAGSRPRSCARRAAGRRRSAPARPRRAAARWRRRCCGPTVRVHRQRHDHGAEGDGDGEQREQQVGEVVHEVAREQRLDLVVAREAPPAPGDEARRSRRRPRQERGEDDDQQLVLLEGVHRLDEPGARRPGGEDGEARRWPRRGRAPSA